MKHIAAGLMAFALLGGCGGGSSNPFERNEADEETDGGTGEGPITVDTAVVVPAALAGNVRSATFDAANGTLVVEGLNLDEVPFAATYIRTAALDRPGYQAFTIQEDPLDRHFTAFAAQSNNSGSVRAVTAGSPGPRNRSFLGGFFQRDGAFDRPQVTETTGQVSYAGTYVGVTNLGDINGPNLLPIPNPGSVDPELLIPQAQTVQGRAFINADFADNRVEGNITGRTIAETGQALPSLVLVATGIEANGTFNGGVEYDIRDPLSNTTDTVGIGDFGGVFGGPNSDGVAGVVNLTQFDGSGNPLGMLNELESGIFVLDQCGAAVSSPICTNVNPDSGTP
ncbi:MAG: thymidylate synthase [Roseovarius sp.]